ncbi:pirin-like C-terminal cupin domain-containing protein, partial [Kitasatospora sp. NPDC057692]|uniref:pirin-like C-terminal cupin domain-containing protein n=1 Tax=Kitasatospora sp. NPDC057692 TaxID=3346215 RepID=UPI00367C3F43
LPLHAPTDASFLLLGGEPFAEKLVMWWNFIGRTGDEILQARNDWEAGTRFGTVHGYDGARLRAPELPDIPLKARGRVR